MNTVVDESVREEDTEQSFYKKYSIWIVAAAAVLFLFLIFSSIFSGVVITITPRAQDVSVDATFSAHKRALDNQIELPFDIMDIEEIAEKAVPATGSETVHQKASGEIIVYNNYSAQNQKLVKNTRFETTDGKIYRIQKSITVPGKTGSGSSAVPGSIAATVYADEEGATFNIGFVDFTLPGLKGSPMYSGFYARSKTTMSGGFSGVRKIVSEKDRQVAETELKNTAREKATQRINQEKPEGFALYGDGLSVAFVDESNKDIKTSTSTDNTMTMRMRAIARGVIFNEQDLGRHIAAKTIANFDGGDVKIPNIGALRFTLLNKETISLDTVQSISFALSGTAHVVWVVDENSIKEKLAGTPKSEFQKIMSGFLNVERAEVSIKPFWKTAFPESGEKIKIETVEPATQ